MVERVAYREMFLTGYPPNPTCGAGLEVAAITTEIEDIIKSSRTQQVSPRKIAGQPSRADLPQGRVVRVRVAKASRISAAPADLTTSVVSPCAKTLPW